MAPTGCEQREERGDFPETTEIQRENKRKSQRAVDRARALSGRLYSAHASCQLFAGACATPIRSTGFCLSMDKHAEQGMFAM